MSKLSNFSSLFAELKRRRVFRVAAAYVVVAFALLQAADIIFPALGLPHWTMTLVVVLAFLGFPVALVLAWAFDITPDGVVRTEAVDDAGGTSISQGRPSAARLGLAALVVLVVMGSGWVAWQSRTAEETAALDGNLLAVLPFRVSADPSLAYLREGMLDLVAASLPADGLRAADPRTVLSAWRRLGGTDISDLPADSALIVARQIGAGQVLLGGIVGTPASLTLNVELRDTRSGRVRAQTRVVGPADSLTVLVDRLARNILVLGAGEADERLSLLADVPVQALRPYLDGRWAYRRGSYSEAVDHYMTALSRDSTFVLAAIGLLNAKGWVPHLVAPDVAERAETLAWNERDRLSAADRLELVAILGPRYPDPSPYGEWIEAARRAAEAAPDRAELWYWYGDRLFHEGAPASIADVELLAARAFDRAIALDSTFADPLNHRVELALIQGDHATATFLARHYLAHDTLGQTSDWMRYFLAAATQDEDGLEQFRARLDDGRAARSSSALSLLTQISIPDMETAERALTALERDAVDARRRTQVLMAYSHTLARNRGQPARAEAAIREAVRRDPGNSVIAKQYAIMNALFWDGESAAAEAAVRQFQALERQAIFDEAQEQTYRIDARCWAEQWRLHQGDMSHTLRTIAALSTERYQDPHDRIQASFCALLLETALAAKLGRTDARTLLERLDAEARTVPPVTMTLLRAANLTTAQLFESRGEPERALAAIRRHYQWGAWNVFFLSTFLRAEGRLAALTGDSEGAVRAYRHYLTLRSDPEPELRPEVDRVRAELAKLTGGRTR